MNHRQSVKSTVLCISIIILLIIGIAVLPALTGRAAETSDKKVTAITIKDMPEKKDYETGDIVDLGDGKLTVTYNDKSTDEIWMDDADVTVKPKYLNRVTDNQKITLTYQEKSVSYDVKVTEWQPKDVVIAVSPFEWNPEAGDSTIFTASLSYTGFNINYGRSTHPSYNSRSSSNTTNYNSGSSYNSSTSTLRSSTQNNQSNSGNTAQQGSTANSNSSAETPMQLNAVSTNSANLLSISKLAASNESEAEDDGEKSERTVKPMTWRSSNPSVIKLESIKGQSENTIRATALKAGKASIIADFYGHESKVDVTVKEKTIPMTLLMITNQNPSVKPGNTIALNAVKQPTNTNDNNAISWQSSDESVAKVDNNGKVTGIKAGTAEITASCNHYFDITTVTVSNNAPPSTANTSATVDNNKKDTDSSITNSNTIKTPNTTAQNSNITTGNNSSASDKSPNTRTVNNNASTAPANTTTQTVSQNQSAAPKASSNNTNASAATGDATNALVYIEAAAIAALIILAIVKSKNTAKKK